METAIVIVFIIGYLAITLEHSIKIDKLVPALLMMAISWALIAFGLDDFTNWFDSNNHTLISGFSSLPHHSDLHGASKMRWFEETLLHHFGKTCEILIFLIGAMTIVEIIDHFNGFATIKRFIKTKKKNILLWIMCILAFILSAIIDNLTATIVLITILRKLINENKDRLWFAGLIIIAANAGGAWSPIGDVTTTMLWMGKKVSTIELIRLLILPSLLCMLIPTTIASFLKPFRNEFDPPEDDSIENKHGSAMLYLGLSAIVFVPIFKTITHLPPYVGMMLSLAIVTLVGEILSSRKFSIHHLNDSAVNQAETHSSSPIFRALSKIEMPSILFFLGILMTVAALESLGLVFNLGKDIQESIPINLFVILLGFGSAVIDNVPLVAASMGMFDLEIDNTVWHFIAYSAGTGGSMLIIGSAAGVVAMGMEKISFFWYLKNIAWLAAVGYLTGACSFLLFQSL
ncbi:MAG: sodium:proton antiporter NhaD [Parvicellaceae bacterium]|tara:strand:+ start:21632 stop:23008 length:1377 start_codon:yes stop_codon:yes gene_type:complete